MPYLLCIQMTSRVGLTRKCLLLLGMYFVAVRAHAHTHTHTHTLKHKHTHMHTQTHTCTHLSDKKRCQGKYLNYLRIAQAVTLNLWLPLFLCVKCVCRVCHVRVCVCVCVCVCVSCIYVTNSPCTKRSTLFKTDFLNEHNGCF
jgi:hypothetical protein